MDVSSVIKEPNIIRGGTLVKKRDVAIAAPPCGCHAAGDRSNSESVCKVVRDQFSVGNSVGNNKYIAYINIYMYLIFVTYQSVPFFPLKVFPIDLQTHFISIKGGGIAIFRK